MRHLSVLAAGVLAAAVVIGCGPGKELPDDVPKTKEQGPKPAEAEGTVPAASEPAAKAAVERAVKAICENAPDRFAKAKVSRGINGGGVQLPAGDRLTDATRRIEAVWPDRARVTYEFKAGVAPTKIFGLRRPHAWAMVGQERWNPPSPGEAATTLYADVTAEYWLLLGLPLTDPRAVAFDAQKGTVANRAATTVKFALPDLPVYNLSFDDQTGHLIRVEYKNFEVGQVIRKSLLLAGHKPAAGLVLPTTLESTQNGLLVERWTIEAWEFLDKLEDSLFDPPRGQ
jgi:hypothetical protein